MNIEQATHIYFIGIGGIGMSALARYFKRTGKAIAGYDRTRTPLTDNLSKEGMIIHFRDDTEHIPPAFKTKSHTLIVYTPAIPDDHSQYRYFRDQGFTLVKRAEILGKLLARGKGIAVAGTHGKTSVSTLAAHILMHAGMELSAFLGGIALNYQSNFFSSGTSGYVLAEADEYDRSFLHLYPYLAVVTSMDADHLDIYGSHTELKRSFNRFVNQIAEEGILVFKADLAGDLIIQKPLNTFSYALADKADFYADNIRIREGAYHFDVVTPFQPLYNLQMAYPGRMNIENAIAAIAVCMSLGLKDPEQIASALRSFKGIKRRFETVIRDENLVYIDDYAHHPEELRACIGSVRELYPGKRITGVFQPHLYTRTRDFAEGFAESLAALDELVLLDIYPAREKPLEGVSSRIILEKVQHDRKWLVDKENLVDHVCSLKPEVLLTLGAGDIDQLVEPLKQALAGERR